MSTKEIDHSNTDEIVCPYCGYEDTDSWEQTPETDIIDCRDCGKKFLYNRDVLVTYTTKKLKPVKKERKTFVLIVSLFFPFYHLRKNYNTFFPAAIGNAIENKPCTTVEYESGRYADVYAKKLHTIRESIEEWEKRAAAINIGTACLAVRYWSGKPYHSKQKEFAWLRKLGTQRITFCNPATGLEAYVDGRRIDINVLAHNDGLSRADFEAWFAPKFKKSNVWEGIILHFTDFRY